MEVVLCGVVSGHSEVEAVPVLVRRIAAELDPGLHVAFPKRLVRVAEGKLLKPGELERAVDLAARNAPGGGVLVVLDCDDGCPAQLGPELLARATSARPGVPLGLVLAKREFEAWFLAAAESIAGLRGLRADLGAPADPEGIRNAKGWLSKHGTGSWGYSEKIDGPALTARFDLAAARARSSSFDKCYREVTRLITTVRDLASGPA